MSFDDRHVQNLDKALDDTDFLPEEEVLEQVRNAGRPGPRQSRAIRAARKISYLQVRQHDDILLLNEHRPSVVGGGRRAVRSSRPVQGVVKAERPMAILGRNKIVEKIDKMDGKFTPERGLRNWKDGRFEKADLNLKPLGANKNILLFVHGTFSNSDSFSEQIRRKNFAAGEAFIKWANKNYDQILAFDHPTLAVSPYINAHTLALAMGHTKANVDVICHSRGGLVTRWWREALDRSTGRRRIVFVGSPLNGTGLASPANIRNALTQLYNFGAAATKVSAAVPLLQFATGFFQIVTSLTRVAGKTPLADAMISMVPGLVAQSRVQNNYERLAMRRYRDAKAESLYAFVKSDFKSERHGWRFWKYFRKDQAKNRLVDAATDFLFDGMNDLVVDTSSMTNLMDDFLVPPDLKRVLDFGSQSKVTHVNYFEQAETLEFIRGQFK